MSRGLGRVQHGCLVAIWEYERRGKHPTTFDIVADVYRIKRDADGNRRVTNAQHVAVKRALEGLQHKGRVIGFRAQHARSARDGRAELAYRWMSAKGLARWLALQRDTELIDRVLAKAEQIGMDVEA